MSRAARVASATTIVCLLVLGASLADAHSYLTNPISRRNQRATQTGCRGPACLGPCNQPKSASTTTINIARGASISVEWPRNNHAGGFIRLAWASFDQSDSHTAFDAGVQLYTCHEVGGCRADGSDLNGGDSGPADGSSRACKTTITVPLHLPDGKYTLQWAWYGGGYQLGDYYSCVDYQVSGGPSGARSPAAFIGGDVSSTGNTCKFFNTDRLRRCVDEPCSNPGGEYPLGQRFGVPFEVRTGAISTTPPTNAPTTTRAPTTTTTRAPTTTTTRAPTTTTTRAPTTTTTRVPTTTTTRAPTTAAPTTTTGPAPSSTKPPAAPTKLKLAFRLDTVQDEYLSDQQVAILDLFKLTKTPVSIGVIANYIGKDAALVSTLKQGGDLFEICNNGFNFEDFSSLTLQQQSDLLQQSTSLLQSTLNVSSVKTFIPPFGAFNTDTLQALISNGYSVVSSRSSLDVGPYAFSGRKVYRFPAGAAVWDMLRSDDFVGVPYHMSFGQLTAQAIANGFAVVTLHPKAFAQADASINRVQLQQLMNLIQFSREHQFEIVQLGALADGASGSGAAPQEASTVSVVGVAGGIVGGLAAAGAVFFFTKKKRVTKLQQQQQQQQLPEHVQLTTGKPVSVAKKQTSKYAKLATDPSVAVSSPAANSPTTKGFSPVQDTLSPDLKSPSSPAAITIESQNLP